MRLKPTDELLDLWTQDQKRMKAAVKYLKKLQFSLPDLSGRIEGAIRILEDRD